MARRDERRARQGRLRHPEVLSLLRGTSSGTIPTANTTDMRMANEIAYSCFVFAFLTRLPVGIAPSKSEDCEPERDGE